MNLRPLIRPALASVLVAGIGFTGLSVYASQVNSMARQLPHVSALPSAETQTFTAAGSYTLKQVTVDVPGQHVPNYGALRLKAIAYAQKQVADAYADDDVKFAQVQQARKKSANKTTVKQSGSDKSLKTSAAEQPAVKPSVKQWTCLNDLWTGESGWQVYAVNTKSGAYGIPQSLPAGKMASEGKDWQSNYKTQINWGLKYISAHYGTPCKAWDQWQARSPHWY